MSAIAVPCPECGSRASAVTDSRPNDLSVRRRRCCKTCGARFTTFEVLADQPHRDVLPLDGMSRRARFLLRLFARMIRDGGR